MHVIVGCLRAGQRVTSIDVDPRQGTLSRYLANRTKFNKTMGRDYPEPRHIALAAHGPAGPTAAEMAKEDERLKLMIEGAWLDSDVIVMDTPGSANPLSLRAHSYADILITPINDSFVDLDVLAHMDGQNMRVMGPSQYAELVWEAKKLKADRDGGAAIDWVVLRNRLSNLDSHNKRDMALALDDLSARIGFRAIDGFGERVIFRELFPVGLTILDLKSEFGEQSVSSSHLAARAEVRRLLATIDPSIAEDATADGATDRDALSN